MEWWKNTLIGGMFFLALSPGFILTLPPISGSTKGLFSKGLIHSLETSNASILAHTVVFLAVFGIMLYILDSSGSIPDINIQGKAEGKEDSESPESVDDEDSEDNEGE